MARNTKTSKVISYSLLGILAVITLFPLFWMFSTSLKSLQEISVFPPVMFPPEPRWENYADATTFVPFGRYAINTVVIAVFYIIGNLLSASLVGYGFARHRFPGRNNLYTVMISTQLMPLIVRLVPLF
jgi:ABC-type glycerol-3-phosphate transport system permease component